MADSWEFHGAFMALSCHFLGTFSFGHVWICHESAMKVPWKCHESAKPRWNLHVRFMSICVCLFLSLCRQCFFWCYFHRWFLRFRLINFFWGFLWSKYRVIRNTQTTNPNPQPVVIWIPSSASTPQVGFMYRTTSPTPEERFKSQGRGRIKPEARCSGVPLGSSARFWDGCRLWEINSRVWKSKRIEEISDFHDLPWIFATKLDCQLVYSNSWCL